MKSPIVFLLLGLLVSSTIQGQIKIGDNPQNIDPSAVLELESTSRVLVITRVTDQEMNAIVPSHGALVYNTETQCIHYFNGSQWINICDSLGLSFSADPVVNDPDGPSTIVITQTGDNYNFEVAPNSIRSAQIVDGGINGVDIQNNSIGQNKLADDSVGRGELQDNTITDSEIDYNEVTLSDFVNDAGFITGLTIVSGAAGNAITDNSGAFFDDTALRTDIDVNTVAIAADGDTDNTNERITSLVLDGTELVITEPNNERRIDLATFNNAGSDNQNLTLAGNNLSIDNGNSVNLNGFLDNTDGQTLNIAGNQLSITGGNTITIPTADGSDTNINGGSNIEVNGAGTAIDPYIIDNTFVEVDGSITNEIQTLSSPDLSVTITPTGPNNTNYLLTVPTTPGANGSETKINSGTNITITGTGTLATPYVINAASGPVADGSETEINPGTNVTITGNGTTATPYIINAVSDPAADGSETIINSTPTVTVTGNGTIGSPYELIGTTGTPTAAVVTFSSYISITSPNVQGALQQLKDEVDGIVVAGGGNPTDELQDLQFNTTVLTLTNPATIGNQVDLDPIFATDTELNTAIALKEDAANKSNDGTLAGNSAVDFPSEQAVKTYVDTEIAAAAADDDITAVSFDGTNLRVDEGATFFSADISALNDSAAIATVQTDVDANEAAANTAIALKENSVNKSTDITLADGTNTLFPTELAVKTYVDTEIAAAAADDDITAVSFDGTNLRVDEGATFFSADISALNDSAAIATVQTDVDANEAAANTAIALKENSVNKSTDVTLADATDTLFPTELAVKTYVDTEIATVTGGTNLSNTNLTQTDPTRIYQLTNATDNLIFTGLGNVGIGNGANPPSNKLHVAGAIWAEGILNSNGNETIPSYRFNGDPDTGMFSDLADEIGFSAGAQEILRLKESVGNGLEIIATGSLELEAELIDSNGAPGSAGQILSSTNTGVEWIAAPSGTIVVSSDANNSIIASVVDGGAFYNDADDDASNEIELPPGGNNGQILSTNGSGIYNWIDDDDNQEANDIDYNNGPSGLSGVLVQDVIDELASNRIIAKGRVTGGGLSGTYTETIAGGLPANSIIQLTVEQSSANPFIIQLSGRTATNFSVQIFEFSGGSFAGANTTWNYTIINP